MGADGGVELMKLKKPAEYSRLLDLLEPFNIRTYEELIDVCASYNSHCHNDWCEENPEICAPKYLLSIYGTDLPGFPCLRDIPRMLEYFENANESYHDLFYLGLDPEKNTFGDIFLERKTRPSSMWRCRLDNFLEELEEGSVLDLMLISEWVEEIKSILDIKSRRSCETWT